MSRREQIKMSEPEVSSFLAGERLLTCATLGPRGWPHLMPLWYVLREASDPDAGARLWAWTYAASQKVRNLERDPRATVQVETGEAYQDLRGVMLECEVIVHRQLETVTSVGAAVLLRNSVPRGAQAPAELPDQAREAVSAQAAKRVALEFKEHRRASWDHGKLGDVY